MKTFIEWIENEHPECLKESWLKNLAIGGTLAGAGLGLYGMSGNGNADRNIPSSSITSPDAADYLKGNDNYQMSGNGNVDRNIPSSGTSSDAASFLKGNQNYDWNSEIGKYKAIEDGKGGYIYRTKNGDFKRVKNSIGQYKFVRI